MPGLQITDIRKTYGDVAALDSVSLSIKEGELFFLLGPSGCGKTTLLRIIAGFSRPDNGAVLFGDQDLLRVPIEKRNIGMVFQNYSLWPHMTVENNVAYGLKMRKVGGEQIRQRVRAALAMVDMEAMAQRRPAELSGGQQQRVALARALVYEPKLLLLDEPLSNLDAKLRRDMRDEIKSLHRRLGLTMIYVTHDQEEAETMAERMALLHDGKILQTGTPQEIYRYPRTLFAARFFGDANVLPGQVSSASEQSITIASGESLLEAQPPPGGSPRNEAEVRVIIRPESIRFAADTDTKNILEGTLRDSEFRGATQRYEIEVNETVVTMMTMYANGQGSSPRQGDTVRLHVDREAIHVIEAENA